MADTLSSFVSQLKIGNTIYPVGSSLYGVCSTAAATPEKVVNANNLTTDSFTTLATGITIQVKFTYENTAENPTLQVGTTAAKPISGSKKWDAGAAVTFTYDGASWLMSGGKASAEVSTGPNDGEITIDGTAVAPKNIAAAAFKAVDSTITSDSSSTNLPTSAAVAAFVSEATGGMAGAMHFKGAVDPLPDPTASSTFNTYEAGDVVLNGDKEYVYDKKSTAALSEWVLLGDEGSYALKTNTVDVGSVSNWSAGSVPTLGTAITADDITNWTANTPTGVSVANGTLTITPGVAASLSYTARSIPNVTGVGSLPSMTLTSTTVVRP